MSPVALALSIALGVALGSHVHALTLWLFRRAQASVVRVRLRRKLPEIERKMAVERETRRTQLIATLEGDVGLDPSAREAHLQLFDLGAKAAINTQLALLRSQAGVTSDPS